jgi:hypothetical protein
MENIPNHVKLGFVQYLDIEQFINISFISKSYNKLCNGYLRAKRGEFQINKTKKNIHNSLYRLTSNSYTPPKCSEFSYKLWLRDNPIDDIIVKIMKSIQCPRQKIKIKITYWVISKMCKVGEKHCIYPEWRTIDCLNNDNFIPFY